MTAKELMEVLRTVDPDTPVRVLCSQCADAYGPEGRGQRIDKATWVVEIGSVVIFTEEERHRSPRWT